MKKIVSASFILVVLISTATFFSGCTTKIGWIATELPGHYKASYISFTGTKTAVFNADKGQTVNVHYQSSNKNGELSIAILDSQGNKLLDIPINTEGSKELKINQKGKYKIIIQAKAAKGNYDIQWEIN